MFNTANSQTDLDEMASSQKQDNKSEILTLNNVNLQYLPNEDDQAQYFMKAGRVDLQLHNSFGKSEAVKWFPGIHAPQGLITYDGGFRRTTYSYQSEIGLLTVPYISAQIFNPYNQLVLQSLTLNAPFVLTNFYGAVHNWYYDIRNGICELAVNTLAKEMGYTDSFASLDSDSRTTWNRAHIFENMSYLGNIFPGFNLYPYGNNTNGFTVYDENRTPCYQMCVHNNQNSKTVFPIAHYQAVGMRRPLTLPMPPKQFEFVGIEQLKLKPNTPIIISEDVDFYFKNYNVQDCVPLAMPCGINAYEHYNFKPLHHKEVCWIFNNFSIQNNYSLSIKKALKFCSLAKENGIEVKFLLPITPISQTENDQHKFDVIAQKNLIALAEEKGIYIPENLQVVKSELIVGSELEKLKRPPYVIAPVIREGTINVIYAGAGCGKSQLAISIGVALSCGKDIFKGKWTNTNKHGIKVLTIAGEMSQEEYGERINFFNKVYNVPDDKKDNFILMPPSGLDLAKPNALNTIQTRIAYLRNNCGVKGQKVDVVILDNLTTLTATGETAACFGGVEVVLKELINQDITLILIHHENKSGEARGAQKLLDIASKVIHLVKGDSQGDELSLLVLDKKKRSNAPSEVLPFKVTINFDEKNPKPWNVIPFEKFSENELKLSGEELSKQIIPSKTWKEMSENERLQFMTENQEHSIVELAKELNCSDSTLSAFRKINNLRKSDMKQLPSPTQTIL